MPPSPRAAAGAYAEARRFPRIIRLPSFGAVSTGWNSINLPLGITVHQILFRHTVAGVAAGDAAIKSEVTGIRLVVDGDPKFDASLAEIHAVQNLWNWRSVDNSTIKDGTWALLLARPGDQSIVAQDGPAYGLATGVVGGVSSASLEVQLSGATIDGLEAFALVTDPEPLGRHICLRVIPDNQGSAGDIEIKDWPKFGADVAVLALHVNKGGKSAEGAVTGPIEKVRLTVDQREEIQQVPYGHIQAAMDCYGLRQQAGYTHVPFAYRGRPMEGLPMIGQDMRLQLTTNAAMNQFRVLVEQLEGVDPV